MIDVVDGTQEGWDNRRDTRIPETAFLLKEINSLTKREQFAMAAMKGICSKIAINDAEFIAVIAVQHADALLAELAKEKA